MTVLFSPPRGKVPQLQSDASHYEDILQGLLAQIHALDLKVGVLEALRQFGTPEKVAAAPVVFGPLVDSLMNDIILTLAKLYEQKADRSIYKLIAVAESLRKVIDWKAKPLDATGLEKHRAVVDVQAKALESIESRRNKSIAHFDKKYFTSPARLEVDFPLSAQQVIGVLNATQQILAEHCEAIGKPMLVSTGCFAFAATEKMLNTLDVAERKRPA